MSDGHGRVLLVEDDPRLGPIMAAVLGENWRVELVTDGEAALRLALTRFFDVLIVDRRLPGIDGIEVVRRLRAGRVTTPVLLLTALGTTADKVEGLDAGANDYLVKPFDFEELAARLRALVRTATPTGGPVEIGSWTFYPGDSSIHSPYSGRILLTDRETALLKVLTSAPDRVFSRPHLLDSVFERGEQPGTVDSYVHYLRRKTEPSLIETVRGIGYRVGTP